MSAAQAMALSTVQNALGWSRTRFWTKSFQLSDLALCAIAEHGALLVGERMWWMLHFHICFANESFFVCVGAFGGGLLLIRKEEAISLGLNSIELCALWMTEKRGSLIGQVIFVFSSTSQFISMLQGWMRSERVQIYTFCLRVSELEGLARVPQGDVCWYTQSISCTWKWAVPAPQAEQILQQQRSFGS